MQHVRNYIREKQTNFTELDFFKQLDRNESPQEALAFIRRLTFFVMVFQDVLRLNEARVTDPMLRRIARHHRAEDKGHDIWFLNDLMVVDGSIPDVRELFSANVVTRDMAYQLMSEVFRTDDDRARVALLFVLESSGHVFFSRVIANAERLGLSEGLLYFARRHLDIELGHEMFEEEMNAMVDAIVLTEQEERDIIALINRSFAAITRMIEALGEPIDVPVPSSRGSVPPPASRVIVHHGTKGRRRVVNEGT